MPDTGTVPAFEFGASDSSSASLKIGCSDSEEITLLWAGTFDICNFDASTTTPWVELAEIASFCDNKTSCWDGWSSFLFNNA